MQIVEYLAAGRAALGALPTLDTILFERFFDESGGMQLVIHSCYGSRVNRAWGLALAQAVLPHVQFRAAGRRHRGSHRPFAHPGAQLRAWPRWPAICNRAPCGTSWCRRCVPRRCSRCAGAGMRASRSPCRGFAAARKCRRRSPACKLRICSPRCSPIRSRAPRTLRARSRFRIIRWCAKPSATVSRMRWTSAHSRRCCARSRRVRSVSLRTTSPSPRRSPSKL